MMEGSSVGALIPGWKGAAVQVAEAACHLATRWIHDEGRPCWCPEDYDLTQGDHLNSCEHLWRAYRRVFREEEDDR